MGTMKWNVCENHKVEKTLFGHRILFFIKKSIKESILKATGLGASGIKPSLIDISLNGAHPFDCLLSYRDDSKAGFTPYLPPFLTSFRRIGVMETILSF